MCPKHSQVTSFTLHVCLLGERISSFDYDSKNRKKLDKKILMNILRNKFQEIKDD